MYKRFILAGCLCLTFLLNVHSQEIKSDSVSFLSKIIISGKYGVIRNDYRSTGSKGNNFFGIGIAISKGSNYFKLQYAYYELIYNLTEFHRKYYFDSAYKEVKYRNEVSLLFSHKNSISIFYMCYGLGLGLYEQNEYRNKSKLYSILPVFLEAGMDLKRLSIGLEVKKNTFTEESNYYLSLNLAVRIFK